MDEQISAMMHALNTLMGAIPFAQERERERDGKSMAERLHDESVIRGYTTTLTAL